MMANTHTTRYSVDWHVNSRDFQNIYPTSRLESPRSSLPKQRIEKLILVEGNLPPPYPSLLNDGQQNPLGDKIDVLLIQFGLLEVIRNTFAAVRHILMASSGKKSGAEVVIIVIVIVGIPRHVFHNIVDVHL